MVEQDALPPDWPVFTCKVYGNEHDVPDEQAPSWDGQTYHLSVGDRELGMELGCAETPGTAFYSASELKPYRVPF